MTPVTYFEMHQHTGSEADYIFRKQLQQRLLSHLLLYN